MGKSFCFTVNGVERCTSEDKPPLHYLRDDLHPHSVKDGCSEGARGTCTIVVDGKAVKPCVLTTRRAVGKNIIITEELGDAEKEAFVYAFRAMGSMQCRFCMPGMVMAGKVLTDRVPDPTEEEIKVALKGNICRCTGYKETIEGIQLTAAILRGDAQTEESLEKGDEYGVGKRALRLDVREKVLGYGEYPDDVVMEGMVYASAVHPRYPWARVLDINYEKAAALPGVLAMLMVEDAPNNRVGHLQRDWDVMIAKGDTTRCVSDVICLMVAEPRDTLEKAKRTAKINYEELEPVCLVQEAMAEDAPKVHEKGDLCQSRHVTRENVEKAPGNSRYMVARIYRTPSTEHAFLEPECMVAFPYKDGVRVYLTDQGACDVREEVSITLGWGPNRVVVENELVGGGFGDKEDISTQHIAALAALKVQRPVKMVLSRQEPLSFHPKRHAMEGTFALERDENGISTGLDCEIYFDTGAYVSLCGLVPERARIHSVRPYCYQNTDIRGFGYCTNNPPAGTFRGPGVCQSKFALEPNIDLSTKKVEISPWEIRYHNVTESSKVFPNGQIASYSTAFKETFLAIKDAYESNLERAGITCAMKSAGASAGLSDKGRAKLAVHDRKIELHSAAPDTGQGCATVLVQMVPEATGLGKELVRNMGASPEVVPDSGTTSGSRQTLTTGEAVRTAAADLNEALQEAGGDLSQLEGRELFAEFFDPTDKLGVDVSNPKSHMAYRFATHVVVLDDDGRIKEVYAAHDSRKIVNPTSIQGQIEGGVLIGLGYAPTGDFPLKNGVPQAKYGTLGLVCSTQIPDIHAIYMEKEELLPFAYGAEGIGEIATIPTAPAAQGVYYAKDHILRTALLMDNTYYLKKKQK